MIYVFRTSIKNIKDVQRLKPFLNGLLPLTAWNFDLEDCDNILRIDSQTDITKMVTDKIRTLGYTCEEMTD